MGNSAGGTPFCGSGCGPGSAFCCTQTLKLGEETRVRSLDEIRSRCELGQGTEYCMRASDASATMERGPWEEEATDPTSFAGAEGTITQAEGLLVSDNVVEDGRLNKELAAELDAAAQELVSPAIDLPTASGNTGLLEAAPPVPLESRPGATTAKAAAASTTATQPAQPSGSRQRSQKSSSKRTSSSAYSRQPAKEQKGEKAAPSGQKGKRSVTDRDAAMPRVGLSIAASAAKDHDLKSWVTGGEEAKAPAAAAESSPKEEAPVEDPADAHLPPEVRRQRRLGPQSKRGGAQQYQLQALDLNPHAKECFEVFAHREVELCGDFAVFYHSYAFAALLYEVNATIGSLLFGFCAATASLPRVIVKDFKQLGDSASLLAKFEQHQEDQKDHHPDYRAVGISAMCSLVALGPEASTPIVFLHTGYSHNDVPPLKDLLQALLQMCGAPKKTVKKLADEVIALAEKFDLDVRAFGGKRCSTGKAGHMLQIFIRRDTIDQIAYASKPWGRLDEDRHPISKWLDGDENQNYGQVRIVAHAELFMQPDRVRLFMGSADGAYHEKRPQFQQALADLLKGTSGANLGDSQARRNAAEAICGGKLPANWRDPFA